MGPSELDDLLNIALLDVICRGVGKVQLTLPPAHTRDVLLYIKDSAEQRAAIWRDPKGHHFPRGAANGKITTVVLEENLLRQAQEGAVWRKYAPSGSNTTSEGVILLYRELDRRYAEWGPWISPHDLGLSIPEMAQHLAVRFHAAGAEPIKHKKLLDVISQAFQCKYIAEHDYIGLYMGTCWMAMAKRAYVDWLTGVRATHHYRTTGRLPRPSREDLINAITFDPADWSQADVNAIASGLRASDCDPLLRQRLLDIFDRGATAKDSANETR